MPIVIKYGGNAMTSPDLRRSIAREIAKLASAGEQPVVVHGGGPFIEQALEAARIPSHFVRGLRVTSPDSLPVIEQTLTMLGKQIAQDIGAAIGLSGRDARLVVATPRHPDLGLVGDVSDVNRALLNGLLGLGITPVIACIAADTNAADSVGDGVLNVNADSVAGAVAGHLRSPVLFLSNTPGVLSDPADPRSLLRDLSETEVSARIQDGRIAGGMIPKVEAALAALQQGASFAVIADGREPRQLGQALQGEAGTRVRRVS
ncbi:MAG: acetylglutamate kinase [Trueperaceae bacterium]|nr:acetylglutamate kinase [Trueperaceae bacterium]